MYASKDVYTCIKTKLNAYERDNPEITKTMNLGKSVNGQDFLVLKLEMETKKYLLMGKIIRESMLPVFWSLAK